MKNENIIIDSKEIGKSLKRIRLTHNLSQKEFAKLLNVSSLLVSKWENGERTPRIETFKKINKLYGITFEEITTGTFKPKLSGREALKYFFSYNLVKLSIILIIFMIMFFSELIENQTKVYNIAVETDEIIINKGTLIINQDYNFNIDEIDAAKKDNNKTEMNIYISSSNKELIYSCIVLNNYCQETFKNNNISKGYILNNLDNIKVEIINNKKVSKGKMQLTLLSNSQELRNLVTIPNELKIIKENEENIDNCIYINKKELFERIEKYNKFFRKGKETYIVRKFNDSYVIYNWNKYVIVPRNNPDFYCVTNKIVTLFLSIKNNKICMKIKDNYYYILNDVFDYYS